MLNFDLPDTVAGQQIFEEMIMMSMNGDLRQIKSCLSHKFVGGPWLPLIGRGHVWGRIPDRAGTGACPYSLIHVG